MLTTIAIALASGVLGVEQPLVSLPHPLISEILYNVPRGKSEGDADQDGKRAANGDEFIEIFNPHSRPISLKGYVLMDSKAAKTRHVKADEEPKPKEGPKHDPKSGPKDDTPGKGRVNIEEEAEKHEKSRSAVRFVFPEVTLNPGEVAVVFNGYESSPAGPTGDEKGPAKKNEKFGGAYVFTMKATSRFQGLSNNADAVLLVAPDGTCVEAVTWGDADVPSEFKPALSEKAPEGEGGSVQRSGATGGFVRHDSIKGMRGKLFSPGVFDGAEGEPKKNAEPAGEAPGKPGGEPPASDKPGDKPKKKSGG